MKNKKYALILLPWVIILVLLLGYYHFGINNQSINNHSTNQTSDNNLNSENGPLLQAETDFSLLNPLEEVESSNQISSMSLEVMKSLPAGTSISRDNLAGITMDHLFYYEEIKDSIFTRITGISYPEDCTIPLEDLRYVRVLHYGFDGEIYTGELIVNEAIARDIIEIFLELYDVKYPIEQMVLVDEFMGDDNSSMVANNTSSFNYRTVSGGTSLSKHAYGLAIDMNPFYNPYIKYNKKESVILPVESAPYADRSLDNPYYIREGDVCYEAFVKHGFTWGGFWKNPDYQHFQKEIN
jgi:hypothetical protein